MILWSYSEDELVRKLVYTNDFNEIAEILEDKYKKNRSLVSVKNKVYKIRRQEGIKTYKVPKKTQKPDPIKYKPHRGSKAVKSSFLIYELDEGVKYLVKTLNTGSYSSSKSKSGHTKKIMEFLGMDKVNYYFKNELGWREAIRIFTPNNQFSIHSIKN